MSRQRKHASGTEKLSILKRYQVEKKQISDLCDEYGLQPSQARFTTGSVNSSSMATPSSNARPVDSENQGCIFSRVGGPSG